MGTCSRINARFVAQIDLLIPATQARRKELHFFISLGFLVHSALRPYQIMTASLLSLPDELLLAVAVYFMIPDRPLEIPSTFGPLTPWSRQKTIYVKPAQLLKEPFAADLFALCRVNKRLYNTASPLLRAEASFDYNTFSSVDLMKVNAVVQKNANIVR